MRSVWGGVAAAVLMLAQILWVYWFMLRRYLAAHWIVW
jgi:hypothetical protein